MATLSGVVLDAGGNYAQRFVRVHKRSTGEILGQTLSSDSTGAWSVTVPDTSDCYVTFHDAPYYDTDFPTNYRIACHWTSNSADSLGNTVTLAGNAAVSGGYMNFDGAGDYVNFSAIGAPGAGDFFLRMLVKPTSISADYCLIDYRPTGTNGAYITMFLLNGGGIQYFVNSATRITASSVFTAGVESELIVCRVSGTTKLFVDGVQAGSDYTDGNTYIAGASRPVVGTNGANTSLNNFYGKIKELSVVTVGRYPTAFTPSYAAFVDALSGVNENARIVDKVTPA